MDEPGKSFNEIRGWLRFFYFCFWILWLAGFVGTGATLADLAGGVQSMTYYWAHVRTSFVPYPPEPDRLLRLVMGFPMYILCTLFGLRVLNHFYRREPVARNSIVHFLASVIAVNTACILLLSARESFDVVAALRAREGFDFTYAFDSMIFALVTLLYFRHSRRAAAYYRTGGALPA